MEIDTEKIDEAVLALLYLTPLSGFDRSLGPLLACGAA